MLNLLHLTKQIACIFTVLLEQLAVHVIWKIIFIQKH